MYPGSIKISLRLNILLISQHVDKFNSGRKSIYTQAVKSISSFFMTVKKCTKDKTLKYFFCEYGRQEIPKGSLQFTILISEISHVPYNVIAFYIYRLPRAVRS